MISFLKNKKKLYVAIFIFAILSISIGYAYLKSTLNLTGRTTIKDNTWNISFANIIQRECNVTTDNPVDFVYNTNNQGIDFDVEFKKADDRYDFLVDVVNNGTIDAMIDSFTITGDEDIDEELNYSVTYLDGKTIPHKCDSLYAGSKTTLRVSISLSKPDSLSESEMYKFKEAVSYHLSININFVQLDDKTCEINDVVEPEGFDLTSYTGKTACDSLDFFTHHNLIIKAAPGTYEGSSGDVIVKLLKNQTYPLKAPVLEGYRNHWTTDHEDNFNRKTSTITMGDEDIVVTANWSDISNYVARINDNYYETIQAAFDDADTGDTVVLLKDTSESPTNNHLGAISFDMHGYSVSGTLTNSRVANLTLINEYGTEEGEEGTKPSYYRNLDGVGLINYGTLTLGVDNESEEPLIDEGNIVAILGSDQNGGVGFKNSGVFNFYDGFLEGYIGLSGVFNKAPEGYYVYVDHNGERNCQKVYLIPNDGRAIARSVFPSGVVMLYWDLQDALKQSMEFYDLVGSSEPGINWANEIGNAKTVEIIRDGWEAAYPLNVYENKTASIDAAGYPIPTGNTISNDGDLYIINSVRNSGGMDVSKPIVNNGTLHLDSIIVKQTTDANTIDNYGDLDIKKSTIRAIGGYAIKVNSGTELIMDSDTLLAGNKHALYNATSNNFTVQGGTIESIKNDGKLTVKTGTVVKKLTSEETTYGILNSSSSSELTLDELELDVIGNEKYTFAVYNENNNAKVTIKGGRLEVTSRRSGGSLESGDGATLIYGGNLVVEGNPVLKAINPNGTARIVYGTGSVVVNGGDWEASGANTAIFAGSGATINGGTIKSTGTNSKYIAYNYSTTDRVIKINGDAEINTLGTCFVMRGGSVTVNAGEVTCGEDFVFGSTWANQYYSNHRSFGTVNINGATINAGGYGLIGTGTVNMGGGVINSVDRGIYFTEDQASTLSMENGRIVSSASDGIYSDNNNNSFTFGGNDFEPEERPYIKGALNGIYMAKGSINFKSGDAIGLDGYGIYVNKDSVFGINDRHVSTSIPMVVGSTYGLYIDNNVSLDVYDGIFKGETHGYYGVITAVADGYQIKEDGSEDVSDSLTLNTCYLVEQDSFLQIERTGSKYNSLQDAIDAAETGDTILVLKDHPVRSVSDIPSNKELTIDFKGHTLSLTQILTNNGTLTLVDSVGEATGGIEALITRSIVNKGTLTILNGHYSTINGMIVDNFGSMTLTDGTLLVNSSASYSYAICNENNSSFTMDNGLIDVNGSGEHTYGIYNYSSYNSPVNVTINNGTIDVDGSGAYNHGIVSETSKANVHIYNVSIDVDSTYTGRTDLANTYGANGIYGGTVIFENGTIDVNNTNGTARGIVESNFTLNDGSIISTGKYAIGSYNCNLVMNHGNINVTGTEGGYAEYDVSERTVTINNDSHVQSNKVCMEPSTYSTITVNDGVIDCGTSFVYSCGYYNAFRAVNIHGGEINSGDYGIYGRGTVVITDGNMTSANTGIYMINEGSDVKVYGGNIVSESKYGILTDDAKDKIYVGVSDENHESTTPNVTGYLSGVYAPKGTVNINVANVIGDTEYGVYSGGYTNFGIDEEVSDVSTEMPMIKGRVNGVYINKGSTVNIYDGVYKGIDAATAGFISGFPDAYTFVTNHVTISGEEYEIKYLTGQDYFLRVNDKENGPEFNSLQQAIDSIDEEDTIYVVADHVIKNETEVPLDKNITLDFNGHTLLSSKSITNNGTLTFVDETNGGGISTSELNPLSKFVINNGKFIINSGNYMGLTGMVFFNTNDMEMNGGYISNNSSSSETYGIRMDGSNGLVPKFKMTGGTIDINSTGNYAYGIYTSTFQSNVYPYSNLYPEINIEDGTINVNSEYVNNNYFNYRYEDGANGIRGGNVTIDNLNLNVTNPNQFAKLFINVNQLTINNGEYVVEAPVAIGIDNSNLVFNGGSVKATGTTAGHTIYNEYYSYSTHISGDSSFEASHTCHVVNGSTTTIDNGTFTCGSYGFTGNLGTFNFNNGIVNVTDNFALSGSGTIKIRDGEINSTNNAINITAASDVTITGGSITSTEGYGLYSTSNNTISIGSDNNYPTTHLPYIYGPRNGVQISEGTLNLGTKDGKIDLSSLTIQGGEYGLNNTGEASVNFYDGILKGVSDGRNGLILTVEEGTDIIDPADKETILVNGEDVEYNIRYLIQTIDIVQNRITGTKYKSLQTAIDEATNDDVLDLIANAQIYYPVTVPEGKEVVLDHQGYEIVTTKPIVNRGSLTVQDSSANKGHHDTSLRINLYENHGTLNISDITLNNLLNSDVRPIFNDVGATLDLNNVTINSVNNVHNKGIMYSTNSIFNSTNTAITDNGSIKIVGGQINATSRGIYSDTNSNGELENVTITSAGNPIYKYSGSSTLLVTGSHMMDGQIYNRSGTLKFVNGDIHNKIINSATLIAEGTTIADESHDSGPYYVNYTSLENSGTLELNNVTYTLTTYNNGEATMLSNSGTFKSNNSTYDVEKTNDYKWCPNYYYQPSCGGNYGHLMYNTGNIISSDSTYNFRLTDTKTNHQTYMYLIENRSGKVVTDGDSFNMEGGISSYGIYSTTSSNQNYLKDTTITIDTREGNYTKAKTKYGVYQTNGEYLAEGTNIKAYDATNIWGVYIDKGMFTMRNGGGIDVSGKTAHGIYIASADATGVVGLKDAGGVESPNVKTDYPEIKAIGSVTGIGVRKINGEFWYYDGKLIGSTLAKPEIATDSETYYGATSYYDEDNDYVYCILEFIREGQFNPEGKVATINNVFYDTLQKAFDKAKAGETIILARADVSENVINNNPNDVTLDLHKYTLAGTITNNGYLTLTNGQLNGGEEYSLINNNIVRLGYNDENIVYDDVMLISDGTSVQNNGTIFMYDGYIKGITALVGASVIEPYYGEVVNEDLEVTVGEETKVYETIYLKEYTGSKTEEITTDFDFAGEEETFVAQLAGYYLLETWGASGGYAICDNESGCGLPGYGGYARGVVYLNVGDTLYINVGGRGGDGSVTSCADGGYNGGGKGTNDGGECSTAYDDEASGGGGGATHIALKSGLLSSLKNDKDKVLIVAGGGGGTSWDYTAGSGGGFVGGITDNTGGVTATQTTGYAFGKGKDASGVSQTSSNQCKNSSTSCDGVAGGGGGWYGGSGIDTADLSAATGGSGYIGNTLLTSNVGYEKIMYGYKVQESTETSTKTISTNDFSSLPERNKAKEGDGYAKVTFINEYASVQSGDSVDFDFSGEEEVFTAPENGYYKLETWGASGGDIDTTYIGGYGAYATGLVYLIKGQKLYINVGGVGESNCALKSCDGGYNGGGASGYYVGGNTYTSGGGGATHIATSSGLLSTFEGKINDLLIVSGGGGGATAHENYSAFGFKHSGGSGGGVEGYGLCASTDKADVGSGSGCGGTQISTGGVSDELYGTYGSFGQGASNTCAASNVSWGSTERKCYASGGGGGLYGGSTGNHGIAGGGSGYIGNNYLLAAYGHEKVMYGYNVTESEDVSTKTISTDDFSEDAIAKKAKDGNGYARITRIVVQVDKEKARTYEYKYTGNETQFVAPDDGYYLLETWGAQGGADNGYEAGYGAYSKGTIYLNKGDRLYINVGGKGIRYDGGYNGGGAGGHQDLEWGYGGGGATHIALSSGLLSDFADNLDDLIIVAGGGGGNGGSDPDATGGSGGGIVGMNGTDVQLASTNTSYVGTGASSETGGYSYNAGKVYGKGTFGQGSDYYNSSHGGAGGGGGLYGGGGSNRSYAGAGGGSGYIGNSNLITYAQNVKAMYSYKGIASDEDDTRTIPVYDYSNSPVAEKAKAGDGYARITVIKESIPVENEYNFDYTGDEQTFIAPVTGNYMLETWGAQGGKAEEIDGGFGGYSSGTIYLEAGEKLYVNVGGRGLDGDTIGSHLGGYNGGGNVTSDFSRYTVYEGSGGGATHIARVSGLLKNLYASVSDVIIVSGGGGGAASQGNTDDNYGYGGSGGGYIGVNGHKYDMCSRPDCAGGGTQNAAGFGYSIIRWYSGDYNPVNFGGFGYGGDTENHNDQHGGAGGGGFYGGASSNVNCVKGGSGGSGYIGNTSLTQKHMTCYNCEESDDEDLKTISTENVSEVPISDYAKIGNGHARITIIDNDNNDFVQDFNYIGNYQVFVTPKTGYYKIESWGASGGTGYHSGNDVSAPSGGSGSYTSGVTYLRKNQKLYIYVGGKGESPTSLVAAKGGWNGGGNGIVSTDHDDVSGGGGGASDIRYFGEGYVPTEEDLLWNSTKGLNSRVMVAAGGGGSELTDPRYTQYTEGMYGGGLSVSGKLSTWQQAWDPQVNQITGGNFGYGSDGEVSAAAGAGGGGGWYGGYTVVLNNFSGSAAGGSSYVSGHYGAIANKSIDDSTPKDGCDGELNIVCSHHSSGLVFSKTHIIDGMGYSWNLTRDYLTDIPSYGNDIGNGHVRISMADEKELDYDTTYSYAYTGGYQKFVVPVSGYYEIEAWGASGGKGSTSFTSAYSTEPEAGKGAYTAGTTYLEKGQTLYLYVGGKGEDSTSRTNIAHGGYNGGGDGTTSTDRDDAAGSGGGATDIRYFGEGYVPTDEELIWNSTKGLNSRVMVAGGGGGSHVTSTTSETEGMNAGGLSVSGKLSTWTNTWTPTVNQTTGGNFGYGSAGESSAAAGAGGGGGWYGGYTTLDSSNYSGRASGGSSYIAGHLGTVANKSATDSSPKNSCTTGNSEYECSFHYSGMIFTKTKMIDGSGYSWTNVRGEYESMPTFRGSNISDGNVGNGFVRISLINEDDGLAVYYANGHMYKNIYHTNSWTSNKPTYASDHLTLPSSSFYVFYSDFVDLSKYKSIVLKKTGMYNTRNGFNQYPMRVNNEGEYFFPDWQLISDNVYVGDITNINRNDFHYQMTAYNGANAGNVYFIGLSSKTIEELTEDISFLDEY